MPGGRQRGGNGDICVSFNNKSKGEKSDNVLDQLYVLLHLYPEEPYEADVSRWANWTWKLNVGSCGDFFMQRPHSYQAAKSGLPLPLIFYFPLILPRNCKYYLAQYLNPWPWALPLILSRNYKYYLTQYLKPWPWALLRNGEMPGRGTSDAVESSISLPVHALINCILISRHCLLDMIWRQWTVEICTSVAENSLFLFKFEKNLF